MARSSMQRLALGVATVMALTIAAAGAVTFDPNAPGMLKFTSEPVTPWAPSLLEFQDRSMWAKKHHHKREGPGGEHKKIDAGAVKHAPPKPGPDTAKIPEAPSGGSGSNAGSGAQGGGAASPPDPKPDPPSVPDKPQEPVPADPKPPGAPTTPVPQPPPPASETAQPSMPAPTSEDAPSKPQAPPPMSVPSSQPAHVSPLPSDVSVGDSNPSDGQANDNKEKEKALPPCSDYTPSILCKSLLRYWRCGNFDQPDDDAGVTEASDLFEYCRAIRPKFPDLETKCIKMVEKIDNYFLQETKSKGKKRHMGKTPELQIQAMQGGPIIKKKSNEQMSADASNGDLGGQHLVMIHRRESNVVQHLRRSRASGAFANAVPQGVSAKTQTPGAKNVGGTTIPDDPEREAEEDSDTYTEVPDPSKEKDSWNPNQGRLPPLLLDAGCEYTDASGSTVRYPEKCPESLICLKIAPPLFACDIGKPARCHCQLQPGVAPEMVTKGGYKVPKWQLC